MSVMLGTKVKEGEIWLPRFVSQVERLDYPINRVVVMYGESRDKSYGILQHWKDTSKFPVEIYADPYIPIQERHGAMLTRVKQDLQRLLKEGGEEYFLNLDCDLVTLPDNLIQKLKAWDRDLIAAMVWTEARRPQTFFDAHVFRLDKCRFHPWNPPGMNKTEPFPVDSVSTCYLAKSEVELAGEYSNPYPHIPFCANLKKKGYQVWVDPTTHVWHIDLERIGIRHEPLPLPISRTDFIDSTGFKWNTAQISAFGFHFKKTNYENMLLNSPMKDAYIEAETFMYHRPLLTASYKLWNESEFIEYSLKGVYDNVDRIDIAYGAVKSRRHEEEDNTLAIIKSFPDPLGKIRIFRGEWRTKEQIQAKLLEVCCSKWLLFIDGDEVMSKKAMNGVRKFCEANQMGEKVYARPRRFLNFWHDFKHIAYSLNPLSPWAQWGLPHAFLVWRDVPGLNFAAFHTVPTDGFAMPINADLPFYRGRATVLDDVVVYHFGNAKSPAEIRAKLEYEKDRELGFKGEVDEQSWFTGEMAPDMVVERWDTKLPKVMWSHPRFGEKLLTVVQKKPVYKFKVSK